MDLVTQVALGAAVGGAVMHRKVGGRALVWGGLLGALPDADLLVSMGDAVSDFTYHRSFSHSLLVLTCIFPLLAWLIIKLHPHTRPHWRSWGVMVWLCLITHPLLDSFTIYGTQLFWPVIDTPFAMGSIFIIDPAYTVPLLISVFGLIFLRSQKLALRVNTIALIVSSCYLVSGLLVQLQVESITDEVILKRGLKPRTYLVTPTPFNILLWRVLIVEHNQYYEGFYSLLDKTADVELSAYYRKVNLLSGIRDSWAVKRLAWFTKSFFSVSRKQDQISMTDLRMGTEPKYVFSFVVAKKNGSKTIAIPNIRNPSMRPSLDDLYRLWDRI